MNLVHLLQQQARRRPHAPAIIDTHHGQRRVTTFAQLEQASARVATLLHQTGLRPGDPVLLLQPMSAELYIALAALFRLGLVAMVIDPGQGRDHLARCCALQPPRAFIGSTKAHLLRLVSPAVRRTPHKFVIGWPLPGAINISQANGLPPHPDIFAAVDHSPALLTFTSGSTGQPKAALRSHSFLLAQHDALAESLDLIPGDVDLATMPVVLLANLASGVTSLIPRADLRRPGRIDPAPVVAQLRAEGVTSTVASPALLERLVDYCRTSGQTLPGLQKMFTGGAPVFPRLLHQLQQIAPQAQVVAVYGSTEAEPMAEIAHHEISSADWRAMELGRGLLTGRPVPAIDLRILPERWGQPLAPMSPAKFTAACLSAEQPGEIVVSGSHVLSGYLHGQGDAETKFRVGNTVWHRTGDAGYLDQTGRLWLLGRCAATREDQQGRLYPFAVECAASHYPDIRRTALVPYHQRRLLAVEPADTATQIDLAKLRQSLAWARLDEIRVLPRIPVDKRHNAKVDYTRLRKHLKFQ